MKTDRICGFDALRAFSVTLVILSHTTLSAMASKASPALASFFTVFNAHYGVRTFFVLSGFLITTILIREHKETGSINVPAFMARRALRILPLYFLILSLAIILAKLGIAEWAGSAFLYSLLYAYNFIPNNQSVNYLAHLWSLAVEEQFYLFWPFVFGLLFARTRAAINAFAAAIILTCYLRMTFGFSPSIASHFDPSLWTIPAIHPIMIGAIFALNVETVKRIPSVALLAASLCLIFGSLVIPYSPTWEIVSTFGIGGFIAWVYLNQGNAFVLRMDWGIIGYLGTISYGLYMWQGFLTGNGPYRAVPTWPLNIWIGAALTFPVAALSFKFFEAPIRRAGLKRLARGKPSAHLDPVPATE